VGIVEQRDFALQFVSQQNRHWHPFLYGLRKGKNIKTMLVEAIKNALSSQTKVDKARWMWGNLNWCM
jgi:chaperone required for assembly of F1-ATPase